MAKHQDTKVYLLLYFPINYLLVQPILIVQLMMYHKQSAHIIKQSIQQIQHLKGCRQHWEDFYFKF